MQAKARARYAFSEFLGRNGKRCTPERLHILDIVMEQRKPFTSNQLLTLCQVHEGINISRATLFNTLPLIVEAGFLRRLAYDKTAIYEVIRQSATVKTKLYMECSRCGKTHKTDASSLEPWLEKVNTRGFAVQPGSAVVYLSGLCSRCRRNEKKNSKSLNAIKK